MNFLRRLYFIYSYFQKPPWDTGISPPELIQFLHTHPPGKAIDLGCGTGTNCITLAKNGWSVTGVDFVTKAIKIAREKASNSHVIIDFKIKDIIRFMTTCNEKYDLILDIGCFHSLSPEKRQVYLLNLPRLLNSSGTFLLYSFLFQQNMDSPGISENEINSISKVFHLDQRINGTEKGKRPSVWLTFRK